MQNFEIERKWFLNTKTIPENLLFPHTYRDFFYLDSAPQTEIRVSQKRDLNNIADGWKMTTKVGQPPKRVECETKISKQAYDYLYSDCPYFFMTKKSAAYIVDIHKLQLSKFSDGLVLAEIEFPTLESYNRFDVADFQRKFSQTYDIPLLDPFFDWTDVTENQYFSSKNYWRRHRILKI